MVAFNNSDSVMKVSFARCAIASKRLRSACWSGIEIRFLAPLCPLHSACLTRHVRWYGGERFCVLGTYLILLTVEVKDPSNFDLLRFQTEAEAGAPIADIREVSNYVDAMMYGLKWLKQFPLSLRLIGEMHALLLRDGCGGAKSPGEFRRTQNWIGGTCPQGTHCLYCLPLPN